jgi:predicted PolB exonuclease-like 3'-5' exonuclease
MLQEIKKENILFIDVETVPQYKSYEALPEAKRKFWDHKASFLIKSEEQSAESLYNRAGIYSEFGKVVCISCGYIKTIDGNSQLFIKSFSGHDERSVLTGFTDMISKLSPSWFLCAHNGKEFDFPYLCRRMVVNGLSIPSMLDLAGKKPWEVKHLDTMELWKFGDYKSFVSLDLLADIFNIPSPKDDMDGSMVHKVYYEENNLNRIVEYCGKDVITLTQVLLRFKGEPFITPENININE